jgi:hypothetical protein
VIQEIKIQDHDDSVKNIVIKALEESGYEIVCCEYFIVKTIGGDRYWSIKYKNN